MRKSLRKSVSEKCHSASVLIMANTRFYLDERGAKVDNPRVLKIAIAHKGMTALISLSVKLLPNQWDSRKLRVVNHPDQMLMNVYITNIKQQVDTIILNLANEGRLGEMTTAEVKGFIDNHHRPRCTARACFSSHRGFAARHRLMRWRAGR